MEQATQAAPSKTRIALPTDQMQRVKSASGGVSFHCGDAVAQRLNGLPLARIKSIAASMELDSSKYDELNPGQQRMNIGNLLRSAVRRNESLMPLFTQYADVQRVEHEADTAVESAALAARLQARAEEKAAAGKAAADAKAEKAQARADKKAAAEQEKLDAKAKREQDRADARAAKDAEKEAAKAVKDAEAKAKAAKEWAAKNPEAATEQ